MTHKDVCQEIGSSYIHDHTRARNKVRLLGSISKTPKVQGFEVLWGLHWYSGTREGSGS